MLMEATRSVALPLGNARLIEDYGCTAERYFSPEFLKADQQASKKATAERPRGFKKAKNVVTAPFSGLRDRER